MHTGNKFINVNNGHIDIHGKPRTKTWTKLTSSLNKGADTIILKEDVDWVVGESIVIPSTSYDMNEAEVFTIKTKTDAKNFQLDRAAKFNHISVVETYSGKTFPMECEVALLSRNIKIHGNEADSVEMKYGGHIMMMGTE